MPRRIDEDHKDFRDVYAGRIRKELKKFASTGSIFRLRGDGKRVRVTIPKINIPRFVFGDPGEGVGRGKGNKGDVIGRDPEEGKGGNQAGDESADGIMVDLEMEEVLKFLQDELQLPDLKPKPSNVYEDTKIKYNNISVTGPESLRHNRRTMLQAMKRAVTTGEYDLLHQLPGFDHPVRMLKPINNDKRYRQYNEIKIPASNAVIFFARDGSGSMDQFRCDIVSDMSWWIDIWVRKFYDKVERMYVWHDTVAHEVDEKTFYNYRYGGGTKCSSAFKLISDNLENRYPSEKWNVYIFYFTDGDNWGDDNGKLMKLISDKFPEEKVNFIGITQVLSYAYEESVKWYLDRNLSARHIRTTAINSGDKESSHWMFPPMSDEHRDAEVKKAILELLGKNEAVRSKE